MLELALELGGKQPIELYIDTLYPMD